MYISIIFKVLLDGVNPIVLANQWLIKKRPHPPVNVQQLEDAVTEEWNAITQAFFSQPCSIYAPPLCRFDKCAW